MPRYEITSPDGKRFEVTAPDGATQEQVLAYAQQQFGQKAAKPDFSNVQGRSDTKPDRSLDPTADMSGLDKFAAGVGKSIVDTGRGLKQAGTDAARYFVESNPVIFGEGGGSAGESLRHSLAEQQSAIDESRRIDAPLMDTGAGLSGNLSGTLGQILVPGGAAIRYGSTAPKAAAAVRAATLPTTVIGNAAQGAVVGALQPVASGDSRAANTAIGGAFGAGGAALAKLVGAGYRGTRSALSDLAQKLSVGPTTQRAGQILQQEASGLASLLRPAESAVPGVSRTLGEQSLDPGVMALENAMRARQRGVFAPLDMRNNQARVDALRSIAGDEADMASALAARSQSAAAARDGAMRAGDVNVSETVSLVDDLIKQQEGRPAVQSGLRSIRDLIAKDVEAAPGLVTTEPVANIGVLDNVRMTLGDMLAGKYGGENAQSLAGSRALLQVRDSLNDEIGRQVPEFTNYLNAYRQGSVPINRMELGRDLIERGSASVRDETGTPRLMPGTFAKANDLDAMAQKATGFAKAKAADILTADDLKIISAIQDDLQRQFARQSSATVGSQTFERGEIAKRITQRGLAALPLGVGDFVQAMQKAGADRTQEKLAYLLANPDEARRVLKALEPKQRAAVTQALESLAAQGTRTGAVALGQQQ